MSWVIILREAIRICDWDIGCHLTGQHSLFYHLGWLFGVKEGQQSINGLRTDLVVNLSIIGRLSQVLLHNSLCKTRSVCDSQFVLNIAEPAVGPCGRNGDDEPSQNIEEEVYRLGAHEAGHNPKWRDERLKK